MQNIESVIAYQNAAVNDVGLEQGADHTDILLKEQGPPHTTTIRRTGEEAFGGDAHVPAESR